MCLYTILSFLVVACKVPAASYPEIAANSTCVDTYLQALLDANVAAVKDALLTISTEATQESALEELLAKVTSKWASIEFTVMAYKDSKDVFILGAIDDIQVGSMMSYRAVCNTLCLYVVLSEWKTPMCMVLTYSIWRFQCDPCC